MAFEQFFETNVNGRGLVLQEYNGNFSIVGAFKTENDKTYMDWCFPRLKDGSPREIAIPQKVTLGNRTQAIKILEKMLASLSYDNELDQKPDQDDIPF